MTDLNGNAHAKDRFITAYERAFSEIDELSDDKTKHLCWHHFCLWSVQNPVAAAQFEIEVLAKAGLCLDS